VHWDGKEKMDVLEMEGEGIEPTIYPLILNVCA
jgi:hypothetical protein